MSEQKFYQWLRTNLPGDVIRIENVAGNGMPDINICYMGIEVWAELKVLPHASVLLRPEQFAWGMRRALAGGSCYVLCKDLDLSLIYAWQFPTINVVPSGKYVRITNDPATVLNLDARQLRKLLFPMF